MSIRYHVKSNYNQLGQISQKIEQANGQMRTYQYQYDNRNRLTQVTLNGTQIEAYGYDANGNRTLSTSTQRQVVNQSATYNNGDQLQASGNQSYAYDANGRLKSKTRLTDDGASITTTYYYSSEGRLLKVVTPNAVVEYQHNALGNRVAKLVNGQVVEKYLWQNKTTLLATYDANDNLKQRFEYTLGHAPTAFTQNGEKYFILSDQIGSPRIITDANGYAVKEITYDSYGNVISDSNEALEIPFGFAGGLQDKDTGLLRFGYRDYDPETGRWTARDPIGFEGGDSNLYGYVLGDPINAIDPTGLYEIIFGEQGSSKNFIYNQTVTIMDNGNVLGSFEGSSSPNPFKPKNPEITGTDAYSQIKPGVYDVRHGLHQGKPALVVNDNGYVPTTAINPNYPEQGRNANFIHIHSGFNSTWKGSAGCPTINPSHWGDFLKSIPIGNGSVVIP